MLAEKLKKAEDDLANLRLLKTEKITQIEADISELKISAKYQVKLLEDLTMMLGGNDSTKNAMAEQMRLMKVLFKDLPIKPELKENIAKIFDAAGGF